MYSMLDNSAGGLAYINNNYNLFLLYNAYIQNDINKNRCDVIGGWWTAVERH
jgi:hypothetical protein